jgi:hypothetical protein
MSSTSSESYPRITYDRQHLIWTCWEVTLHYDNSGLDYVVARGANLTRKRAEAAANSWLRVLLRQRGMLH